MSHPIRERFFPIDDWLERQLSDPETRRRVDEIRAQMAADDKREGEGLPMSWLQALFAERLRSELKRKKMTQGKFAAAAGITEKQLSSLMVGRAEGSLTMWGHLLDVLDEVQP